MDIALESDAAWVARRLREAEFVVAFTGAGMSTASGIPDFAATTASGTPSSTRRRFTATAS